jgi:hypothetical protein
MDEVLFGDLSIRLGVQYLYMHQVSLSLHCTSSDVIDLGLAG